MSQPSLCIPTARPRQSWMQAQPDKWFPKVDSCVAAKLRISGCRRKGIQQSTSCSGQTSCRRSQGARGLFPGGGLRSPTSFAPVSRETAATKLYRRQHIDTARRLDEKRPIGPETPSPRPVAQITLAALPRSGRCNSQTISAKSADLGNEIRFI